MTEIGDAPLAAEFRFGEGRISGVLSLVLGALAFGAVLCMIFPSLLTSPELRDLYPMSLVRGLVQVVLVAAFALGVLSVVLSRRRVLGLSGIAFALAATLLGGSEAEVRETSLVTTTYLGLDWFILNLFFLALVFVPIERVFGRLRQRIFRKGWRTDLAHFFASHVFVQVTVLLTMLPAALFFRWAVDSAFQSAVASQPIWLQLVEAIVLADLVTYTVHRLFHVVPFLWRFHAIHHSSERLDWLAASRLHLVDIVVLRALAFVPLYVMGFSPAALYPYLVLASVQGILIHSNLRFRFGLLRYLLATPLFHHWHHTAERHALDRNFAFHLPVIDWIFGTYHQPDAWPEHYGIEGSPVPEGWWRQLLHPLRATE